MFKRLALAAGFAALLAGCSASGLSPPGSPTNEQIVDYVGDLREQSRAISDLTPREFLLASVNYSNQRCDEFFDAIGTFERDSTMVDSVLTAAIAAGTPLYPVYEISQKAQTLFSSGLALAGSINGAAREIYAFAPYAVELRLLTKKAQNAFLSDPSVLGAIQLTSVYSVGAYEGGFVDGDGVVKLPNYTFFVGDIGHITRDEAFLIARHVAQAYAQQCTLANLNSLVRGSINSAEIGVETSTSKGAGKVFSDPVPSVQ